MSSVAVSSGTRMRSELRQRYFGVFERKDVVHRELGIGALFDAHAAPDQHRNLKLHFVLQFPVGLGKTSISTLPAMSSRAPCA